MTPFTTLTGRVQRLPEANIDTDVIYPARFLLITARDGLGRYAFHDRADFALDTDAPILVAGANFGCGSSREQAVWALAGAGIRCIIAPSFGEIFHGNCLRNGVLPVVLPEPPAGAVLTVDLETRTIVDGDRTIPFAIAGKARLALLNGWDETALILNRHATAIAAFETAQRGAQPWLWQTA